jgi:hypothetical protein
VLACDRVPWPLPAGARYLAPGEVRRAEVAGVVFSYELSTLCRWRD